MEDHFDHVSYEATDGADGYRLIHECGEWLKEQSVDSPVCVYAHFFQPHGPYDPPPYYIDRSLALSRQNPVSLDYLPPHHREVDYVAGRFKLLGRIPSYQAETCYSADPLRYLTLYEANILYADSLVREFVSQWGQRRGGRRTVFIITADHGECMGEHGHFFDHGKMLVDSLLHVPLIIHDTARPVGEVIASPVSHLDLPERILEWAGAAKTLSGPENDRFIDDTETGSKKRLVISQHVPSARGVLENPEIAAALTQDTWRLVYNDCPFLGNHCVLETYYSGAPSASSAKAPLPFPSSTLPQPKTLAPGVTMESLGIHTNYVHAGRDYPFSGELSLSTNTGGTLILQARMQGRKPLVLGEYDCQTERVKLEGTLPGELTDTLPKEPLTPLVVMEAVWRSALSTTARESPIRLFAFPVFTPRLASDDVQFIGMDIETPVLSPGDNTLIHMIWRFTGVAGKNPEFTWRLLNEKDKAVMEGRSTIHYIHIGSRFTQSVWFQIPPTFTPGRYRFQLQVGEKGESFITGAIDVTPDRRRAFFELLKRDTRLSTFRTLHSETHLIGGRKEELITSIQHLAKRYPEEGHFSYLLAKLTDSADERVAYLTQCLDKTPFHLAALRLAAKSTKKRLYTSTLQTLTPENACDYTFQNGIRLYGYDIKRSPNKRENAKNFYVTLYWEALAANSNPYGVDLWLRNEGQSQILFWFPGAGKHPINVWKIGEAVVETIDVPIPEEWEKASLLVLLFNYWDFAYAGMKDEDLKSTYIAAITADGQSAQEASLGEFTYKDLPLSEIDFLEKKRNDKANYQLYDLSTDPREMKNVVNERPDVFDQMQPMLRPFLEARHAQNTVEERTEELSEEALEKLRGLGYIR